MAEFPFVGSSYTSRTTRLDAQRTVNLYPEISEDRNSRTISALIGTPGLKLWKAVGTGPIRGMMKFNAQYAIVVSGVEVYRVDTLGNLLLLGTVSISNPMVSMASNGIEMMLVTGLAGYVINPIAATIEPIANVAFTGADTVDYLDGFMLFNQPGTGRFQATGPYTSSIDALDFATAEGSPDLLVSLIVDHREAWLFGETSTEVYYNAGGADFPFERITGAFIEVGCAAKFSPAKIDNTVFWLGADNRGFGMIYRAVGYQPQRISTHAIEHAIHQYTTTADAIGYTYQQEGHSFYVLNFPSGNATWVYDVAAGEWHERAYRDPASGQLGRHRGQCHMAFAGMNLVGDYQNGNIYQLDLETFTDNGDPLPRIRRCMHLSSQERRVVYNALEVLFEQGVGLDTGQGQDPQALLRWSEDAKYWSNEQSASMGKVGQTNARLKYNRLGSGRNRIFELTITDPVRVAIVGATLKTSVCKT